MFGTITSEEFYREEFEKLMVVRRIENKATVANREKAYVDLREHHARMQALAATRKANMLVNGDDAAAAATTA